MNLKTKTIVAITNRDTWKSASAAGEFTRSTLDSTLAEIGFIHCSFPNQTLEIVNRKFSDRQDLILLLIDVDRVKASIKYEGAPSGRAGTFPHIYGPLNTNAVYAVLPLDKDAEGNLVAPSEFQELESTAQESEG